MKKKVVQLSHTPGPWRVMPGQMIFSGDSMRVCDIRGWGHLTGSGAMNLPSDQAAVIQDANARLIAAAPDLLAACKMIASFAVSWQPLTPGDIRIVTEAIAKAELVPDAAQKGAAEPT